MLEKEIDLNGEEVTVHAIHGELENGVVYVTAVQVNRNDDVVQLDFDQKQNWKKVNDVLFNRLLETMFEGRETEETKADDEKVDIADPNYDEPLYVSPDTQVESILREIYNLFPCTTLMISKQLDIPQKTVSSAATTLKQDELVGVVDKRGQAQVLVPTHLGIKELYTIYGMPNVHKNIKTLPFDEEDADTGLDALYNDNEKDEKEEEKEESIDESDENENEETKTVDTKLSDVAEEESSG